MGPAIRALRPAVAVSRENPIYLAVALVTLAVSGLGSLLARHVPVVGELLNSVLVTPALAALMIGMAAAGLASDAASIGDGVESLRSSYRSLVGAYVVLFGAVVLVIVAWLLEVGLVVALGGGIDLGALFTASSRTSLGAATDSAALGVEPAPMSPATAGLVLLFTLLALAIALVGGIVVQFFDVAIVVDGASALSSFGDSWRLFRESPVSVLGYSVLRMVPVATAGGVVAGAYVLGGSVAGSLGAALLALLVAAVVGPVTFAFITAYHVAYYDVRLGRPVRRRRDPVG